MAGVAEMHVVVRGTFLDVRWAGPHARLRSSPPAAGRCTSRPGDAEEDGQEAAVAQIARLDAIVRSGGNPVARFVEPRSVDAQEPRPGAPSAAPPSPELLRGRGDRGGAQAAADGVAGADRGSANCAPPRSASPAAPRPSPNAPPPPASAGSAGSSGEAPVARGRPCKGKRERLQKAMAAIEQKVAEDPDLVSRGEVRLPAYFDEHPQAKVRIMAQLAEVAAAAHERIVQDEAAQRAG